jgi:hypothetical protein
MVTVTPGHQFMLIDFCIKTGSDRWIGALVLKMAMMATASSMGETVGV